MRAHQPGYTAENLDTKGIHEVAARRFCLVAADHPLVSAISENAEKLQMGEISVRTSAHPFAHPPLLTYCVRPRGR